jgi:DNA-binding MarR family transcriptional regulator
MDRLVRAAAARYPAVYGELGIAKPGLVVLVTLASGASLRQARISERTGIDKATLVGVLNDLGERGLTHRAPDPTDRRAHAVSITPKGLRLLQRAAALSVTDDFFAALSRSERTTLDRLLRKLVTAHGGSGTPLTVRAAVAVSSASPPGRSDDPSQEHR